MAMILTMTACVAKSDTQATTTIELTTTEATTVNTEADHECKVEPLDIYYESGLPQMTHEEISDYLEEMVHIAATEDLCWFDMNTMGHNFVYIWEFYNSYCDKTEFEVQAIAAFNYVFEQANEQGIPFDYIENWSTVPVAEVLCKFYGSKSFSNPRNPYLGTSFRDLNEEDAIKVAKVYFSNPLFATNTEFAAQLLYYYPNGVAADMAWEHLIAASKSSDSTLSRDVTTYYACLDIFRRYPSNLSNAEKVTEIAKNILQNDNYDFVQKYVYLCSDFASESDFEDVGKEINDMAYESLLELAQNASEEDYALIARTVAKLYDKYDISSKYVDTLLDNYNVDLLTSCLVNWKEIAKTKLPSWY